MYKVNLKQIIFVALMIEHGFIFQHDIYNVFLAVSGVLLAYFISLNLLRGRFARCFWFIVFSVSFSQLIVVIRRAVMDVGFRQMALDNPIGVLVGDIVYGFKAIYATLWKIPEAIYQAWGLDSYSTIEALNYRFLTTGILGIAMLVFVLQKPVLKMPKVRNEEAVSVAA